MIDLINDAWSEKYRPRTLAECILPEQLKQEFEQTVRDKYLVTSIFAGPAGMGKTTVAKAVLNDMDADYIFVGGRNSGIDTLRTTIEQFATSMSLTSEGRKYVIVDEADAMTPALQQALRESIESFSANCGFIFTCNYPNRIMKELHSRAPITHFRIPSSETTKIAGQYFKRACFILDSEKITYDKQVVASLVKQYFPDFRRVINELQKAAKRGPIDIGTLASDDKDYKNLYKALKDKNFSDMRKWIATHALDSTQFVRKLYDDLAPLILEASVPQLILLLAQYQFYASQVADQEINLAALCTEIMSTVIWK